MQILSELISYVWFPKSNVWFHIEKYERKLNIIKNLYILKLFNIYIIEENKWNKFEKNV